MFCKNCGKEINQEDNFCGSCGSPITKETYINNASEEKHESKENDLPNNLENYILATRGRRFVNLLLDYIYFFLFSVILGIVLALTGLYDILNVENWNDRFFSLLIMLFFYIFFETIWAKTPAKFITKTRVVSLKDGKAPDFKTVVIRTLCRFIPFEPFSFFILKSPVGWHDRISKTIVVHEK